MSRLRVGLIFGGRSGEHEVSLASASSIIAAIDQRKYEVVPIGITKAGQWLLKGDPMRRLREATAYSPENPPPDPAAALLSMLQDQAPALQRLDVVFPVLHGPYGEDGTLQGFLELLGIPYVGAGVAASAIGMDKALMKVIFRAHGIPTVDFRVLLRADWEHYPQELLEELESRFGYPCFVKPANLGSSVGVTKAHSHQELRSALERACRFDRKLLVEEAVEAREIECSVLGNDRPTASLLGEVVPHREFYDYVAKYADERTQLVIPAPLPEAVAAEIQSLALRAFTAIDCAGMARVDFFLSRDSLRIYVNEINTIPGFTSVSMYPKLWEATGIPYPRLIDRLIELAMERHQDRKRNRISEETPLEELSQR